MSRLRLKRLLKKGSKAYGVLQALEEISGERVCVVDEKDKILYGSGITAESRSSGVSVEDRIIAYVHATRDSAHVASVLSELFSLETEKKELASEVLERYRELNLLYDLADQLSECQNVETISKLILKEAQKLAPCSGGALYLGGGVNAELVLSSSFGIPLKDVVETRMMHKLYASVFESGKGQMVDDLSDYLEIPSEQQSAICVPIKSRIGVNGILVLYNSMCSTYNSGTLKIASSLAGQASPAIESARLYDREQELSKSFARFVPNEFFQSLGKSSVLDVGAGENARKEMSIFFSDIRAFTTLVEGKTPEESYQFINDYLACMEPSIRKYNGFVDNYIGDAILALFDDGGADNAVQAAIDSQMELQHYNLHRQERGEPPVSNGIGISTGQLMLGTLGSSDRLACSVIGDSVNTAARVESLTKTYKAAILITDLTYRNLIDPTRYLLRPVDKVRVKGKNSTVTIYEVMNAISESMLDKRLAAMSEYMKGWREYQERRPDDALVSFANALKIDKEDRVTRLYLGRCFHQLENGIPEDWDGVATMTSK